MAEKTKMVENSGMAKKAKANAAVRIVINPKVAFILGLLIGIFVVRFQVSFWTLIAGEPWPKIKVFPYKKGRKTSKQIF